MEKQSEASKSAVWKDIADDISNLLASKYPDAASYELCEGSVASLCRQRPPGEVMHLLRSIIGTRS